MTIVVYTKNRYAGTCSPSALNTETTVLEITGASDDYLVEGWLDLGALASGDTLVVTEYVAIDGVNYRIFLQSTFSGAQNMPAIRFHTKTFLYNMKYKVTVNQTAGVLRSFPYGFIQEILGTL
jgi:hypothetical protein